MAKTIKFNLICDEQPIRTIEDLQNHFSIEDVLSYYDKRLLHRWLSVRGYDKELNAVSAITSSNQMDIIRELIRIFEVPVDTATVEESIYAIQYQEERRKTHACYEAQDYKTAQVIQDYKNGYQKCIDEILAHPQDAPRIKASIAELTTHYAWVLELNHRKLFYTLQEASPLAIMCLLMNEKSRGYYLPAQSIEGTFVFDADSESDMDKKTMFDAICSMISSSNANFKDSLGENLLTFQGTTDEYWKDLEPKGKKYMILSMGSRSYVRAAGERGGDLPRSAIVNQFVILDGIDYKSNSTTDKLRYMEV